MRFNKIAAIASLVFCVLSTAHAQPAPPAEEDTSSVATALANADQTGAAEQAQRFLESLDRQTGAVTLLDGKVTLSVPETHYYLGPADSRRVLVDVWGNPPQAAEGVLGMIFLAEANPYNSWGAVLEYQSDGHVDDSEAATINYEDLMRDMQEGVRQSNPERVRLGYPEMTLDGWAEQPHYEQASHTLYWAKLLSITDARSLNYDVRVLGRDGVFVMSFVALPEEIGLIRTQAPAVMAIPEFTDGNRYADYQPGVDRAATYGIGGLIAGGTLAAVAQKTGIFAILLAFGKKFIVLILAGFAAIASWVGRMFGRKRDRDVDPPSNDPAP